MCIHGQCICQDAWHGRACHIKRCPNDCSGAGYCFNGVWEKLHQFFFDSCHTSQFIIVNGIHFQADQTMQMVILKDFASHSASFGLVLGAN